MHLLVLVPQRRNTTRQAKEKTITSQVKKSPGPGLELCHLVVSCRYRRRSDDTPKSVGLCLACRFFVLAACDEFCMAGLSNWAEFDHFRRQSQIQGTRPLRASNVQGTEGSDSIASDSVLAL